MTEQFKRRLAERVLDADYTDGLDKSSMEELATMRNEVREVENEVSFERRLCQARIDILTAELDHRAGRVEGDVMSRLAQILADENAEPSGSGSLPSRPPDLSVPRSAQQPRRRVDEIVGTQTLARLTKMAEEDIRSSVESLAELERSLSARRKQIHEVQDRIQAEIVRRYTSGEADETSLLT